MSRYHHNKTTHELEPIAGYGSRVATSVDGKTLTVHSSILNIDGYNYGSGDIGAAINMIATIESGMVATKDYDAGECFVYNAILYVVTEDVEDGDEFVVGLNCALAPTLSEQIFDVNGRTDIAIIKADSAAGQLVVDGAKFYFDSHDGKYGYNTSAARGADTFVPFNNIGGLIADQTVTIPTGTLNPSITFTNEANLILFYSNAANRPPSLWYKTTALFGNTSSTPSVVSIDSSGKTCVLNIPSYASQYYAVNLI